MQTLRRSQERGLADHGWLKSRHTFSFADYFDPKHVEFGPLRVINEDRVQAGAGFGTHGHRDMEILTYVLSGALAHRDSLGTGSTLRPGDVQRMSAGRGVQHSEFNPSRTEPVHFLQIWIQPNVRGIEPSYEQKHFDAQAQRGRLCLIASPDGAERSLHIHQDARVYAASLNGGDELTYITTADRGLYLQLADGSLVAGGTPLQAGDGLQLTATTQLTLAQAQGAQLLLFDLPLG